MAGIEGGVENALSETYCIVHHCCWNWVSSTTIVMLRYYCMVHRANIFATVKQSLHRMQGDVDLGMLAEAKDR